MAVLESFLITMLKKPLSVVSFAVQAFLGLVLACVLAEIVLQIADHASYDQFAKDPETQLRHFKPNFSFNVSSACFENEVVTNNVGFHGWDYQEEKSPGVYRIAVVGSSFVEALQVSRDEMFTSLLQEKLNTTAHGNRTYEVIPFGLSGNGTYVNLLYYKYFVAQLHPDLVLNIVTDYEINQNRAGVKIPPRFTPTGEVIMEMPHSASDEYLRVLREWGRKSKLLMNLFRVYTLAQSHLAKVIAHPTIFLKTEGSEESDYAKNIDYAPLWKTETVLLDTFAKEVKKDGAEYVLVLWQPTQASVRTVPELSQRLGQIASSSHFSFFDMSQAVGSAELGQGQKATWDCDGHWSKAGHRYVSDVLYTYVSTQYSK
jgi:stress-induced morphogen